MHSLEREQQASHERMNVDDNIPKMADSKMNGNFPEGPHHFGGNREESKQNNERNPEDRGDGDGPADGSDIDESPYVAQVEINQNEVSASQKKHYRSNLPTIEEFLV
jgi:hypothetical protein